MKKNNIPKFLTDEFGNKAHLVAISKEGNYYVNSSEGLYVYTNKDNKVLTTLEAFFENAIMEDYEKDEFIMLTPEAELYIKDLKEGDYSLKPIKESESIMIPF